MITGSNAIRIAGGILTPITIAALGEIYIGCVRNQPAIIATGILCTLLSSAATTRIFLDGRRGGGLTYRAAGFLFSSAFCAFMSLAAVAGCVWLLIASSDYAMFAAACISGCFLFGAMAAVLHCQTQRGENNGLAQPLFHPAVHAHHEDALFLGARHRELSIDSVSVDGNSNNGTVNVGGDDFIAQSNRSSVPSLS